MIGTFQPHLMPDRQSPCRYGPGSEVSPPSRSIERGISIRLSCANAVPPLEAVEFSAPLAGGFLGPCPACHFGLGRMGQRELCGAVISARRIGSRISKNFAAAAYISFQSPAKRGITPHIHSQSSNPLKTSDFTSVPIAHVRGSFELVRARHKHRNKFARRFGQRWRRCRPCFESLC